MNKRIENIIDELVDQYTYGDKSERPWIIGFSGVKHNLAGKWARRILILKIDLYIE